MRIGQAFGTTTLVMVLTLASCAQPPAPAEQAAPANQMDPQRLARIPERMQAFVNEGVISGAVMLLARGDEVGLLEAVGFQDVESRVTMRTDTIFQVQSMTKPVTAVGILMLVEDGLLRLNDPVELYLPEFKGQMLEHTRAGEQELLKPSRSITIRDLLTHTSGMEHGHHSYQTAPPLATLEEVVSTNARLPLLSEPGAMFRYSSLGFETLGRVIEVVSGKPYEVFLQERIFGPLDMTDTFFKADADRVGRIASIYRFEEERLMRLEEDASRPFTYANPAGGMFSTAMDMLAFYRMMLEGGVSSGKRVLSKASVEAMTTPHVAVPAGGLMSGFGLGWWVVREPIGTFGLPLQHHGAYGHAGYWGTIGWVDPETELIGVFLIQHRSDELPRRAFAELFVTMAAATLTE